MNNDPTDTFFKGAGITHYELQNTPNMMLEVRFEFSHFISNIGIA